MKKFTIVTVCLNAADTIGDTIQSVLEQTDSDFEYLIKDGCSKDETVRIARSFASVFAERGIPYRVISQPDSSVYDAMNQAARLAEGTWLLYMNAGDLFADAYVLEMVSQSGQLDTADIVYGDRIDSIDDGYWYLKAEPLEIMRERKPFSHQSVFAKKELNDQFEYPLQYPIGGDYAFFYHWYAVGKKFAYVPIAIGIFDRYGISSNEKAAVQDMLQIHQDKPECEAWIIEKYRKRMERLEKPSLAYRLYSWCIPACIRKMRRMRRRKKEGWMSAEEFMARKARNGGRINLPQSDREAGRV